MNNYNHCSRFQFFFAAVFLFSAAISADAALVGRSLDSNPSTAEAYYDADLNIIWLADANLALSESFGIPSIQPSGYGIYTTGQMNLATLGPWLSAVNSLNGTGYLGINTWRVPVIAGSCQGYCPNGEFGHLFYYDLGGTFDQYIFASTDPDISLFSNIHTGNGGYWYQFGYSFRFDNGAQQQEGFGIASVAWLVADGDFGAAVIPIPAAFWLFGSGLLGLFGFMRRRKKT